MSKLVEKNWADNQVIQDYAKVFGVEPIKRLCSLLQDIEVPPVSRPWNESGPIPTESILIWSCIVPYNYIARKRDDDDVSNIFNSIVPANLDDVWKNGKLIFRFAPVSNSTSWAGEIFFKAGVSE